MTFHVMDSRHSSLMTHIYATRRSSAIGAREGDAVCNGVQLLSQVITLTRFTLIHAHVSCLCPHVSFTLMTMTMMLMMHVTGGEAAEYIRRALIYTLSCE